MNSAVFKKNLKAIDTTSLVDKVEKNLVEILQRKKLKVGDSIPKELELAENAWRKQNRYQRGLAKIENDGIDRIKKEKRRSHHKSRPVWDHE